MRTLLQLFIELLWLAGAALVAWYFLWTFLTIEVLAAGTTFALWKVERTWQ